MKKVALFFGSFNPIHNGHLILANYIAEYAGVDEVRFVVSPQNPFKKDLNLMDDECRLRMVKKSIEGYPKFSVTDVEFSLPKPSYTYDTLSYISEQEKNVQFLLIMGGDNLPNFHQWKNAEKIVEMCEILVYPRPDSPNEVPEQWKGKVRMLNEAPLLDISSTVIRRAVKENRDVRFFTTKEVWEMLKKENFSGVD
ncbi:MAG: nicotinate-nucleotide adenylyltransferase [Paludibacteraceae bacterium]|nr:nicotinate-nucleotide adenylyltransferase [Paludibacteraceae bacterium]